MSPDSLRSLQCEPIARRGRIILFGIKQRKGRAVLEMLGDIQIPDPYSLFLYGQLYTRSDHTALEFNFRASNFLST